MLPPALYRLRGGGDLAARRVMHMRAAVAVGGVVAKQGGLGFYDGAVAAVCNGSHRRAVGEGVTLLLWLLLFLLFAVASCSLSAQLYMERDFSPCRSVSSRGGPVALVVEDGVG